jgi:metallo-beta-lactamase class B
MRTDKVIKRWLAAIVLLGVLIPAAAQDSDAVSQLITSARDRAGSDWSAAVDFLCSEEPVVGTPAESPVIEPTKLFDNLYVIGREGTVVYALTTSEGIILIDAGYEGQEESVLLTGLESLGLSPDDIEYVIVAHGHRDHYGGARYLQENHGAKIILSEDDWNLIESAEPVEGAQPPPTRDLVATAGEPITLGDTQVSPILIPGHTPGSLGVVFQVRDGNAVHSAALFGGTILIAGRIDDQGLNQYVDSIAQFAELTAAMDVDVEIQNHPIFDNFPAKLTALKERRPAAHHPFVVGKDAYQDFLGVISDCTLAEIARRDL